MLSSRYRNDGGSLLFLSAAQLKAKRSVERKIRDGVYRFERVPCAVCGGDDFQPLAQKDRCGLLTPVVMCDRCGLVQTNPRMTAESFREYYNAEYRLLQDRGSTAGSAFARERRRGRRIARYLGELQCTPSVAEGVFVVEVGCGAGGVITAFRERGFDVQGLDIAVDRVAYGRDRHGLDLLVGTLADVELRRPPQIVIYSHVLEHIVDVGEELERLRGLLPPGGIAYLEVPGIKRLDTGYEDDFLRYLQNAHCYHFSLATLTNLLVSHGFERVAGDELVRSAFRVSERSVTTGWQAWQDDRSAVIRALADAERRRLAFHPKAALRRVVQSMGLYPLVRTALRWLGRG